MLKDALQEMVAAYKELKMEIPRANCESLLLLIKASESKK
jgi:hypothetical protein